MKWISDMLLHIELYSPSEPAHLLATQVLCIASVWRGTALLKKEWYSSEHVNEWNELYSNYSLL